MILTAILTAILLLTFPQSILGNVLTCSVLWVSSIEAGVTAQIIEVFAFPPREFCNILVSLQSLNGTKLLKKKLKHIKYQILNKNNTIKIMNIIIYLSSLNLLITFANTNRLVLIKLPSLKRIPTVPATDALSEPAKSTKF